LIRQALPPSAASTEFPPAMRLPLLAGLAALAAFSSTAHAANDFPGAPGVVTLSGKCAKLVVGTLDASKSCKNELASVTLANGGVTFIFSADGKMLGFGGDGTAIKAASGGAVRLPVDLVSTGVGTKMTGEVKVSGSCSFGNPYAGKPTTIECSAKSADFAFTGSFRTNGKPPQAAKPPQPAKPQPTKPKQPEKQPQKGK